MAGDALVVLLLRLGQVHLHAGAEFPAHFRVPAHGLLRGQVLRMHAEIRKHAAVSHAVDRPEHGRGLLNAVAVLRLHLGIETDERSRNIRFDPARGGCLRAFDGERIHVRVDRRAAGQHLQDGVLRAEYDLFRGHAVFDGHDGAEQPVLQRQIAPHAPHQGHGGVAVGVREAGHQQIARHVLFRAVLLFRPLRADIVDGLAFYAQKTVLRPVCGRTVRVFRTQQQFAVFKKNAHRSLSYS